MDWSHNFGLNPVQTGEVYGKMFGILVVLSPHGELGYLAAFSGKVDGKNHHAFFVPPVFDLLEEQGFYRQEEDELSSLNRKIEILEQNPQLSSLLKQLELAYSEAESALTKEKQQQKTNRQHRQLLRLEQQRLLTPQAFEKLEQSLIETSKRDHFILKDLKKFWKNKIELLENELIILNEDINKLKEERKNRSATLQQKIFDHYYFLNAAGQRKNLNEIFTLGLGVQPPAGAGECAAPKLLQYAFLHGFKPICMAEFWWGESPTGEIRKHKQFYPACRSKCMPILNHMLAGTPVEENPLKIPTTYSDINIIYEDASLLVVDKPPGLLSVPGKEEIDSVYLRVKQRYPEASGPLIVHRLDMATSGLMLVALTDEAYKDLQNQFLRRIVKKQYVALLDGIVVQSEGFIDLPLRVDLDDRPRQMVCYDYGKSARTEFKIINYENGRTRIHFHPITGRTHQLRVHAAHPKGLNCPIVGDDLYGISAERLYLHAETIEFIHPFKKEIVKFTQHPNF